MNRRFPRLLMVEDEETINQVFCRLFQLWKWDTRKALTCGVALDYLRSNERFDLIILDLMLPDCDGICVLRWIYKHEYPIRVIVSTGRPLLEDGEVIQLMKDHKEDVLINKPCVFDHIQRQADIVFQDFFTQRSLPVPALPNS